MGARHVASRSHHRPGHLVLRLSQCRRGYRDGGCPGNDVPYRLLITVLNSKLKIGQVRFFYMPKNGGASGHACPTSGRGTGNFMMDMRDSAPRGQGGLPAAYAETIYKSANS
ncbi:hypothetical protein C3920_00325 [Novacetimonas pomaceti]|uniref:Uncharacterized protein n=1 Tax=Novacetimonas pomaceti TaxID=2021998 RepID=A0ABX5PB09_9PROT|nr:hypothetical protein C3920_00325 [Novacetimonas pomaceti]